MIHKNTKGNITDNRYYTVKEAAQILRVHPRTVRRWLKEGKLKGKKIGRIWLIPKTEIDE